MIVVALLRFHYGRQNRLRAKRLGESGGQAARDAALVHSFEDRTDMVRFVPVIFLSFHIYIYIYIYIYFFFPCRPSSVCTYVWTD